MNLHFESEIAKQYNSKSQKIRVLTEDWVKRNQYCPICGNDILNNYDANKPVADFYCSDCQSDFELKSKEICCCCCCCCCCSVVYWHIDMQF